MAWAGARIAVALLLLVLAVPAAAQGLPGLQQFEVENARLILLDKDGARRGTLEGKLARKKRDGNVEVQGAVLTMTGKDGKLVVRAAQFDYTPATDAFSCPSGLQADLPDGGWFEMPVATGTITMGAEPVLVARGKGDTTFRSAAPDKALLVAAMADPEITIRTRLVEGRLGIAQLLLQGQRGGEFKLRVDAVPAPDGRGSVPGVLTLGCFGDISARHDAVAGKAAIGLLRRARIGFDGEGRPFEVTAAEIKLRGLVAADAMAGGSADLARSLGQLEIDASGTVHVGGPTFEGFGNELSYREPDQRRELVLRGNPSLDVDQAGPRQKRDRTAVALRMKSRRVIELTAPLTPPEQQPEFLRLRLESGVQVWREVDTRVEWRISGALVEMESLLLDTAPRRPFDEEPRRREYFRVESEGYSPMLRVAGRDTLPDGTDEPTQRAAVFGARASGRIDQARIEAEVRGPEILALLYSEQRLADEMRFALGLRRRETQPDQTSAGRLTVRARDELRVSVAAGGLAADAQAEPLGVSARGAVELEHTPLPRDDRDLVSFTGDSARLVLQGTRVNVAELSGDDSLATLGYDLLLSRGFRIASRQPHMDGFIGGPGRLVVRDTESLSYFRRAVERLPRRGQLTEPATPDAGWMNFEGDVTIAGDADTRRMEVTGVELRLVLGEFETPRAGKSAVKDLPELLDAEVIKLYLVRGRRLQLVSIGHATVPPSVLNLLRLEGDALVRSETDRMQATAQESIEASGADDQRAAGNPLSVVLLGRSVLQMEDAGLFFGDVVRTGTFSYDGAWVIQAGDRLEITFRPLAVGDPVAISGLRQDLSEIQRGSLPAPALHLRAWRARQTLARMVEVLPPAWTPESEQPRQALAAVEKAELELRGVVAGETGVVRDHLGRIRAARYASRAEKLMSGLIEVAASGGVDGRFASTDSATPALNLGVEEAVVTFNGAGEVVDTTARGTVRVARGDYVITGSRLSQARDGTLLLDDARVTLPANTGMEITGVRTVSLRHRGGDPAQRTMVTRVTGRDLKVNVKLNRGAPAPSNR